MTLDADLNLIAVLLAVVAAFGIGALWYGPLFGARWQMLAGITDESVAGVNMGKVYGSAFALQLVAVVTLALVMGEATVVGGALIGLVLGGAFVATALGVTYLFSQKPLALWAIDAGYHVTYYTVAGAILGAF
ncbi:DUF1761 domain-containing protein [Rubrivirga sp. IMCC43871]|uniref:DUF1761 domain-containing protein n=1 Tax=Rubrivirga sp. IMCC43871 TaxID=3391575 RepID=UPI00398FF585